MFGIYILVTTIKKMRVTRIQELEDFIITSCLYKHFRHPIFTGISVISFGLAIIFANWDGLLVCPLILQSIYSLKKSKNTLMLEYNKNTNMLSIKDQQEYLVLNDFGI